MVGVATADLRNTTNQYDNKGSLCIAADGYLFSNGTHQIHSFKINTGSLVRVEYRSGHIHWSNNGQVLCSTVTPERLRGTPLFPVCWIRSPGSWDTAPDTPRLQFLSRE